ncbi:MAG: hypothetical protein RLY83_440 [Actinomycetota bacterium]
MALPILLFPSVLAVMLPINVQWAIPIAAVCTTAFVIVLVSSAPVVALSETTLQARGASIEKKLLGHATVIPKDKIFEELGPKLDARSWLAIQSSIKGLVKVTVTDPNDPTPYWLISTRNPERLASLINN